MDTSSVRPADLNLEACRSLLREACGYWNHDSFGCLILGDACGRLPLMLLGRLLTMSAEGEQLWGTLQLDVIPHPGMTAAAERRLGWPLC